MKKILFTVLILFIFMNITKADSWQEDYLDGDNVETEYRYRFYKDSIDGKYVRKGIDTDYQYEDSENIKYSEYSLYQTNCPTGEGYETEYATKYEYQERLPVQYLRIKNSGNYELDIANIEVIRDNTLIAHEYYNCENCTNYEHTINPGGVLTLELEYPVPLKKINLILEFYYANEQKPYELLYSTSKNFSNQDLIAFMSTDTTMTNYQYDDFYLYPNYTSTFTDYNIEVDDLINVISQEEVCRAREIMTYRYNIIKDYYDDNYYKDITELTNLTDEERLEYKKDQEAYKVYYRNKDNIENNKINLELNEDVKTKNESNELKLVKTGVTVKKLNYKYLILFILSLILISLILLKHVKRMSNENDD